MNIADLLRTHYAQKFLQFGATSNGVDWEEPKKAGLRYGAMLQLIPEEELSRPDPLSLLDVGCGYGAFYAFLQERDITNIIYTGVDLVADMVKYANGHFDNATFLAGDILEMGLNASSYDYVIANGIFTQKLTASNTDMDLFLDRMIETLFAICRKGIAFNIMTTFVDFENPDNYYRHPGDMVDLSSRFTRSFRVNHSYPLYEYTMCLYK